MSDPIYISGLATTDGHLRDVPLELSPALNCIIGARGTCKSTIVETIRFVFNDEPGRVNELLAEKGGPAGPAHSGLIRATLKGGTARLMLADLTLEDADGGITLERDASSAPRVYFDGVKAVDSPSVLNEIEIYSQGELQEIAISPGKRLALVDRPHKADIDEWLRRAAGLAEEIAGLGPRVREIREAIAAAERTIRDGEETRAELTQAQADRPAMSPEMVEGRKAFQERERLQARAATAVDAYRQEIREIESAVDRLSGASGSLTELKSAGSGPLEAVAEAIGASLEAGRGALNEMTAPEAVAELLERARKEFEAQADLYRDLLQKEQEVTAAIRREDRLSEEVEKLDRLLSRLAEQREELDELEAARAEKRQVLREIRTRIFRRRLGEVDRINSQFSEKIILSLNHGAHSTKFRERLEDLLAGSRIRERTALCEQIAAVLPPERLVSFVDDDDAQGLASILNRDSGQMVRLISHLSDSGDLYGLEEEVAEDELDITMFIEGKPRAVHEMSKGQQATAILPLVLRAAPYPLILDQPEDDLDNHFIFETLVEEIEKLKRERQLIFVTHNANIPVVGDAERVFVMTMDGPEHATLAGEGTVDEMREEIVDLLEGGRDAFELRSRKYGYSG